MSKNHFYITTTLPYVNSEPHIGFALEIIQADTIARYKRLQNYDVFFNTGTDEHGQKIYQKSKNNKQSPEEYCDYYALKFNKLKEKLNLSYNSFIRTTDDNHIKSAQAFWQKCLNNGDIYKKVYKTKYCIGCEMEKTDSELDKSGQCPLHPKNKIEYREEENYFFRFSKYQHRLLKLYENNPNFVLPRWRQKEITNFVKSGLQDFSISRLKNKMPWGVPVPNDPDHVMYVWFDALVNYISSLKWPDNKLYQKFWPGMQVAGKDNLRQQTAMWQAMLISAGLPTSTQILIHGFITSNGQKMSKSIGNVVNPFDIVNKFGTDALRFYLLKEINPFEDGDFTQKHFIEIYNTYLANGLGNLIQRSLTLVSKYTNSQIPKIDKKVKNLYLQNNFREHTWSTYYKHLQKFEFNKALDIVWEYISKIDKYIDTNKPWQMAKESKIKELNIIIYDILESIHQITWMIYPFLPTTAVEVASRLGISELQKDNPDLKVSYIPLHFNTQIKVNNPIFPRIK